MAKGKATPPAAGKLAGKKVAFVGKFGYRDWNRSLLQRAVQSEGGAVVEPTATPDCLVYGEGRGGNLPGDVAKIQKKHPAVQVYSVADFAQLLTPDRDEFLQLLRAGAKDRQWWEDFARLMELYGHKIDLRGCDLSKVNLSGAKLESIRMDGADLSGATLKDAEFGSLKSMNLNETRGEELGFDEARECTFRNAKLPKLGIGSSARDCDFTGAQLTALQCHHVNFEGS